MSLQIRKLQSLISQNGLFADGDWVESKDQDPNGEVRLIQLADIGTGEFVDKSNRFMTMDKAKLLRCTFLEPGDILIARMPDPIGRACIFPGSNKPCVTVVDVCIMRPLSSDVDSRWLMHTINSKKFNNHILNFVTGTTRQRISRGNLAKLEIPLPPLPEQKRIAAILDKADSLHRKNQQAIQLADKFLRAVFLDMFGDPVTNPKGWDVKELDYCLIFLTSGARGWAKHYSGSGDKFIRIQNVSKNKLLLNDLAYVNAPDGAEANRTKTQIGDVLLSITADLGRAAVVIEEIAGSYINQHLALLRVKQNKLNPRYLAAYLSSEAGVTQFKAKNKSAVKAGLNFTDIRTLNILLPPIELQNKYEELYKKVTFSINYKQESLQFSESLFKSLSQKAFSGEL